MRRLCLSVCDGSWVEEVPVVRLLIPPFSFVDLPVPLPCGFAGFLLEVLLSIRPQVFRGGSTRDGSSFLLV